MLKLYLVPFFLDKTSLNVVAPQNTKIQAISLRKVIFLCSDWNKNDFSYVITRIFWPVIIINNLT